MSRRVSLPGADELFRNTATLSAVPSQRENTEEITQTPVAAPKSKNTVRQTPRRRVNAFDRTPLVESDMMRRSPFIYPPMNFMI